MVKVTHNHFLCLLQMPLPLLIKFTWGPPHVPSKDGFRYYVYFIDDFSRYTWIYPLKAKDQAFGIFLHFKIKVELQLRTSIKEVQSNWGGEYRSFAFFLHQQGILLQHPFPHTHHHNGWAERKHCHITETGIALLAQAGLPFEFW